ncbi:glycosyltransferase family A protein [Butyrivibrio sp. VCD2006]|uniref:glycosyltransferase family A protein n=1 Tax=Butyrivibrio sp. VCD2006 TaxID=1280664 RepID=UPI000400F7D2|nr:glycosyltransferase family 2 protein [Butyrivibrio sp. VCD2006]
MDKHVRIQVFIPTRNNVNLIEETLNSIWNQDYPREDIYVTITDFGSTDGTYEKLLEYDSYHLGIYQDNTTTNPRIMIEKMARNKYIYPEGWYTFQIVLYPGDILYPNYMKVCSKAFIDNQALKPESLICEVDKIDGDGNIIHQPALFDEDRIIDGNEELKGYVDRGFQHQIQCMGYLFYRGLVREVGQVNEQRWWNKWARLGYEKMTLYIHEPLALQRCVKYDDELEEILLRWEWMITIIRTKEAKFGHFQDESFYRDSRKNIAQYAIWRSFLLVQEGKMKDAEDCFLISGVLDSNIEEEDIYKEMGIYLKSLSKHSETFISGYFDEHGWN